MKSIKQPLLKPNKLFIKRMEKELIANAHKGNWNDWHPTNEQALKELMHHVNKLHNAIEHNSKNDILEFSADIANITEKIFTTNNH